MTEIARLSALDGMQNALFVVLAHPHGITANEVADLIGLRVDATMNKLRKLREAGYIGPSKYFGGNKTTWMPKEESEKSCKANAIASKEKRAQQKKAHKQLVLMNEQAAFETGKHRVIPAHMAPKLRISGVRWVFELAS